MICFFMGITYKFLKYLLWFQQPSNIIQRKFSPARDPCSVQWDVMWDSLATMELSHGKKDRPKSPHSRVIIYLQTKSTDFRDQIRIIKCVRETSQALEVYTAIEQALKTYGPNKSKVRIYQFSLYNCSIVSDSHGSCLSEISFNNQPCIFRILHCPLSNVFRECWKEKWQNHIGQLMILLQRKEMRKSNHALGHLNRSLHQFPWVQLLVAAAAAVVDRSSLQDLHL